MVKQLKIPFLLVVCLFQLNNINLIRYNENYINIDFKILWIRDADVPFFFSVLI
jgi:hypothetical protein